MAATRRTASRAEVGRAASRRGSGVARPRVAAAGLRPERAQARDLVRERLLAIVDSIPRACVATYAQVAREAGLPRHARHVGAALRALPAHSALPWHRVLNAQGRVSLRDTLACRAQRRLLEAEGVAFDVRGRVDLARFRWQGEAPERARGRQAPDAAARRRAKPE